MSNRFQIIFFILLLNVFALAQTVSKPAKLGVKSGDVKIPLSKLVPSSTFVLGGSPDWIAIDNDVWISNKPKSTVSRIDPRENKVVQTISGFDKPCSGLAVGAGSLWVPNCGNQTLSRVDLKTGSISAAIPMSVADSEGGLAFGAGSVWLLRDKKSTLVRIDPETNAVVATVALPEGCYTAAFGFDSVWVSCTMQNTLLRIDPKTNSIAATTPVGPAPRFLTAGEGSVWTLNQGDGTITRIDPANNKVVTTIDAGIPGEGGDISAGEGYVWATSMGFPLARIDPKTNEVLQQFVGQGGDAIRAANGMVWLSNYKSGIEWRLDPKAVAAIKQ